MLHEQDLKGSMSNILPIYNTELLVSKKVLTELLNILPEPRKPKTGRKPIPLECLLNGILQVLVNGVAWRKIAFCGCSYISCYRYFRELQKRGKLKLLYKQLSILKTNISECAIDTDTINSFRFKSYVGWDGKHRKNGTKISILTDQKGLPADIEFGKGNKHDIHFVENHIKNTSRRRKKLLNLYKGYTSKELRRELRKKGIKINMETRQKDYKRKRGPKFGFNKDKYKTRFLIERQFAWIESFKRLRTRVERLIASFKAFVYLALIIILMRN